MLSFVINGCVEHLFALVSTWPPTISNYSLELSQMLSSAVVFKVLLLVNWMLYLIISCCGCCLVLFAKDTPTRNTSFPLSYF